MHRILKHWILKHWALNSQGPNDVLDSILGIAEQHCRVVIEEQRILDTGISRGHRSLEDNDVVGMPHAQYRHTGNRTGRVSLSGGIDGVVGPDHQHDIGISEVVVDLIHFQHDVVGNLGLSEQDIHVTGQAASDRVDAESNVRAVFAQLARQQVHHRIAKAAKPR